MTDSGCRPREGVVLTGALVLGTLGASAALWLACHGGSILLALAKWFVSS